MCVGRVFETPAINQPYNGNTNFYQIDPLQFLSLWKVHKTIFKIFMRR